MRYVAILILSAGLSLGVTSAQADPIDASAHAEAFDLSHDMPSGSYFDVNQDTGALFASGSNGSLVVDNTIYFGILSGASHARNTSLPAPEPTALSLLGVGLLLVTRLAPRR